MRVIQRYDQAVKKAINLYWWRRRAWILILLSLMLIANGVASVIGWKFDLTAGIFLIVFGAMFTPLIVWLSKLRDRRYEKTQRVISKQTVMTFTFEPDRCIISQINDDGSYRGEGIYAYSCFYRVYETEEMFILWISNCEAHYILKSAVVEGSVEELSAFFADQLGQNFFLKYKKRNIVK